MLLNHGLWPRYELLNASKWQTNNRYHSICTAEIKKHIYKYILQMFLCAYVFNVI